MRKFSHTREPWNSLPPPCSWARTCMRTSWDSLPAGPEPCLLGSERRSCLCYLGSPLSGCFPAPQQTELGAVPPSRQSSGQRPATTHRRIGVILLHKLPVVVVVESGVGLDSLLLTQVLVVLFDAVNSGTGNLQGARMRGSAWGSPI